MFPLLSLKYFFTKELEKYFTVIRIDLRGHGKTPIGDKEITMELLSDDIYQLLKTLYIEKYSVVGFSLGGSLAIDLTLNHPKLVKSLVLISTYAKADDNTKQHFKSFNKNLKKIIWEFLWWYN